MVAIANNPELETAKLHQFVRRVHWSLPERLQAEPDPAILDRAIRRAQCQVIANQIIDLCRAGRHYAEAVLVDLSTPPASERLTAAMKGRG